MYIIPILVVWPGTRAWIAQRARVVNIQPEIYKLIMIIIILLVIIK